MTTYEGGNAEGSPGRHAARFAGSGPTPRVRDHGSAAGRQRRAVRPADRHHLPGAAPPGAGWPGAGHLVGGRRAAAPRIRADRGRPAHAGCRTGNVAGVLRRRHRPPGARAAAGDVMTAGAPPRPGAPQPIESYLAQVAAALPGTARARGDIVAELRGGLLDATDAYRSAGLAGDTAAEAALREFGHPRQLASAYGPELAAGQARRVALTLVATGPLIGLLWAAAAAASNISIRHAPPWQWPGAPADSRVAFPLAAAAIAITVWTALFTAAATASLIRLTLARRAARRCLAARAALICS